MELDHHCTIHLCPVHVVDALHSHQVAVLAGLHLHVHHVLVTRILVWSLAVVQVLMDRYILQMILVLFLAAESKLCAFVQLISIAFTWNVHHDEVFS